MEAGGILPFHLLVLPFSLAASIAASMRTLAWVSFLGMRSWTEYLPSVPSSFLRGEKTLT